MTTARSSRPRRRSGPSWRARITPRRARTYGKKDGYGYGGLKVFVDPVKLEHNHFFDHSATDKVGGLFEFIRRFGPGFSDLAAAHNWFEGEIQGRREEDKPPKPPKRRRKPFAAGRGLHLRRQEGQAGLI